MGFQNRRKLRSEALNSLLKSERTKSGTTSVGMLGNARGVEGGGKRKGRDAWSGRTTSMLILHYIWDCCPLNISLQKRRRRNEAQRGRGLTGMDDGAIPVRQEVPQYTSIGPLLTLPLLHLIREEMEKRNQSEEKKGEILIWTSKKNRCAVKQQLGPQEKNTCNPTDPRDFLKFHPIKGGEERNKDSPI